MTFWAELKRRKVVKVAVAYAVVAWLLIQVAATLLPTFGAPPWTLAAFSTVVILGFPIALVLAWAFEITPDGIKVTAPDSAGGITHRALDYFVAGLLVVAGSVFMMNRPVSDVPTPPIEIGALAYSVPSSPSGLSRRFLIDLGDTVPIGESRLDASIALSPDGQRFVYAAQRENSLPHLYLQDLDQLEARPIPGTTDAENPFFSSDGEWIGFGSTAVNGSATLNKISVHGGPPQTLVSSIRAGTGGFWSSDDTIFYTSDEADGSRLRRISASGRAASEALQLQRASDELAHTWPYLLPNGDSLLFTNRPVGGRATDGRIDLLTLSTGAVETLIESGYNARYAPSGHVVFMRSGTLWAVPFDPVQLRKIGPEVPVVQGVQTAGSRGESVYAFSQEGLLVYRRGIDTQAPGRWKTLLWVDHDGTEEPLELPRDYRVAAVAPDGRRIALETSEAGSEDIWIYDLDRSTLSRLTFDSADDYMPLWTPDGQRVVYGSDRDGGLWWRAADGTGQAEPLVSGTSGMRLRPLSFSPDGTQLVYQAGNPADLFVLSLDSVMPRPLLRTDFTETMAAISPNGRWIAYVSNEAADLLQVYVRPFPDVEAGKWQVSIEGGIWPKWSADGEALYFVGIGGGVSVWMAAVETEDAFQFERPRRLFSGSYSEGGLYQLTFDALRGGGRFLLARDDVDSSSNQESGTTQLVVVDHWFDELRRLAPPAEPSRLAAASDDPR